MRTALPRLIPAGLAAFLFLIPCHGQSTYADLLEAQGALGIGMEEARELESKLGQLLIVNVDGFGYDGPLALHPRFVPMVKDLQIGGVIPHYGSADFEKIRKTNRALAEMTSLPLLLCVDYIDVKGPGGTVRFGDGFVGGFIGRFSALRDGEFRTLARLNALMLAAAGVNVLLGPTVDDSTKDGRTVERARVVVDALRECGIQPVLKHYPYLPVKADLHSSSPDTRLPAEEVRRKTAAFSLLRGESEIMMVTHTFNSLMDGENIATFSSAWSAMARRRVVPPGFLMSDDLLMLSNYADRRAFSAKAGNTPAEWAQSAILAGDDFIIVSGSDTATYKVFEGVLRAAAEDSDRGRRLRQRIREAYGRIERFKESRMPYLTRSFDASLSDVRLAVSAVPADAVSARFTFDPGVMPRLSLAFAQARMPPSPASVISTRVRRFLADAFVR